LAFVDRVKSELGHKATHRKVVEVEAVYTLREDSEAYAGDFGSENEALSSDNTIVWEGNAENTKT